MNPTTLLIGLCCGTISVVRSQGLDIHSPTYLPTYLTAHVHTKGKNLELGGIFILRGHTSKRLGINGMK